MQIATPQNLPIAPGGCMERPPIGQAHLGQLDIVFRGANRETSYELTGPVVPPVKLIASSRADAIQAVRNLMARELRNTNVGYIVRGSEEAWTASAVNFNRDLEHAFALRSKPGRIESWQLTTALLDAIALIAPDASVHSFSPIRAPWQTKI